jgi:hypothetical protein
MRGVQALAQSEEQSLQVETQVLRGIPRDKATLLLAHEPDYADTVISSAVDLQLSGDSHGGQVRLPLLASLFPNTWLENARTVCDSSSDESCTPTAA